MMLVIVPRTGITITKETFMSNIFQTIEETERLIESLSITSKGVNSRSQEKRKINSFDSSKIKPLKTIINDLQDINNSLGTVIKPFI